MIMRVSNIVFFNDTATTEIYTLPYTTLFRSDVVVRVIIVTLDILLGCASGRALVNLAQLLGFGETCRAESLLGVLDVLLRSEEHTSELQSRQYLVCRLLLEKNKIK